MKGFWGMSFEKWDSFFGGEYRISFLGVEVDAIISWFDGVGWLGEMRMDSVG